MSLLEKKEGLQRMKILNEDPLMSFLMLAYFISWVLWSPLFFLREDSFINPIIFLLLGGFGPMLSAIIISKRTGCLDELKRSVFKWNVRLEWYVVAFIVPLLILIVSYGVFLLIGGVPTGIVDMTPYYMYPLLLLFVMLLGGGLEEPGWRGFGLPLLLKKYNPFISSIIIGLFWAFWHLPLFFVKISSQFGLPLGWYIINALALSIIFTWLYIRGSNSVILAIILHGGINAAFAYYPALTEIETGLGTISYYGPITIGTWIIVLFLILINNKMFFQTKNVRT